MLNSGVTTACERRWQMGKDTAIQWTDSTWNPWRGCTKVHTGCTNCYAETQAKRNPGTLGLWGPNGTRVLASAAMWKEPIKWNALAEAAGERHRVFCASLADIFEDWQGSIVDSQGNVLQVSNCKTGPRYTHGQSGKCRKVTLDDVRADLFKLIDSTPNLDWQILTKRPENIRKMWTVANAEIPHLFRNNVHLLYSASDQASLEAGIGHLLRCRDLVPVIGLSLEPLVGPVDLSRYFPTTAKADCPAEMLPHYNTLLNLDWVIVGGESGGGARPFCLEWAWDIVLQCKKAGVPCFVKQMGEFPVTTNCNLWDFEHEQLKSWGTYAASARIKFNDKKGGDLDEWPEQLQVREFPKAQVLA